MRLSVALLRDIEAEMRAKEKAEAPTVKTKEQAERDEQHRARHGATAREARSARRLNIIGVWKRKFRPLPEPKAVDLFADVVGDGFILCVAGGLIVYEYYRAMQKPDSNLERIKELNARFGDLERREQQLEDSERLQQNRVRQLEDALRGLKDPRTKMPLLPPASTSTPATPSAP